MIIDNLDEDYLQWTPSAQQERNGEQTHAPTQPLWAYFSDLQGPIIITSRNRRLALEIVEDEDIVTIDPMDEGHALSLFEKKLGPQVPASREELVELTAALDFMPLAIVQAAVYIRKRWPRLSVKQYLEKFEKSDHRKISLLGDSNKAGHLRRDREAKSSIFLTLRISFDYIQETRPSAADLLSLMSFFDRQGIPNSLLWPRLKQGSQSHDESEDEEERAIETFEDDVLLLREYSLISISTDTTLLGMHRMVQLATHDWLTAHTRLEFWRDHFVNELYHRFPEGKFENWAQCQEMFAHVLRAELEKPSDEILTWKWTILLTKAALFAWTKGNYVDSIRLAEKSFTVYSGLSVWNRESAVNILSVVGLAYTLARRLNEAENIERQVLEIRTEVCDHLLKEHTMG